MRSLSKSKILAYRQCPKRLWLEIYRPESRDDSASAAVFQVGHQVGEIAQKIYDPKGIGDLISIEKVGYDCAFAHSKTLLAAGAGPIFEAGVKIDGALSFADVMLPVRQGDQLAWKMVEVKSSSKVKDYHRDDIALQAYVATASGVQLSSISLAHIDSTFVYPGDGDYRGLLKENDLTEEALSRSEEARGWVEEAQKIASLKQEPVVEMGSHCKDPVVCGFCKYCGTGKLQPEFPLNYLPRLLGSKREHLEAEGFNDLREVPDEHLSKAQARVKKHSISGEIYFDALGAESDLAVYGFPAYFLDFETATFAVPIWKGTRPFQQLPFQYSLHILEENGVLLHKDFLDLTGNDPSRRFAESLLAQCVDEGPVFVYNAGFEKMVMRNLATAFPDLAAALNRIIVRVVDLLPIARSRFYHPKQKGSWSIKKVLTAAIPELSYDQLDGVQDGGMAVLAYMEAIAGHASAERKDEVDVQLRAYCQLDTLAMVRLWEFFKGSSGFTCSGHMASRHD